MTHGMNSLSEKLLRGESVLGLIVKMPATALVESAGYSGFDLVVVDTEHGIGCDGLLEQHLQAAGAAGIPLVVRVGSLDRVEILHALDAGAIGVIIPHVKSVADAQEAVRAAHYPPFGYRGLALSTRAGRYGTVAVSEHLERWERETVVIGQVEDREALDQVSEIAAVPRLSAIFIGPSDLSLSLGFPGQLSHPTVVDAVDGIVKAVVVDGDGAKLCVLARDESEARGWTDRGAGVILFSGIDIINARIREMASLPRRTARID